MFGTLVPLRWPFEPSVLVGVAALTAAYLGAVTRWRARFPGSAPVPRGRVAAFLLAMATILLALQTPIAPLSDDYSFAIHMIEHLLLTLAMPPLALLGLPGWLLRPLLAGRPAVLAVARALTNPFVAFGLFNALFVAYHTPAFYDFTLAAPPLHAGAHGVFMVTALLTWWPVLSPLPEVPPLAPPLQLLYLFAQTLPSQALGASFAFAGAAIYRRYAEAPRVWAGVSPLVDQQLGGLIMWVLGGTFFLGAFAAVFLRWATSAETRGRRYRALDRAR